MTNYKDAKVLAEVSEGLGEAMTGIGCDKLTQRWANKEPGNKGEVVKGTSLHRVA